MGSNPTGVALFSFYVEKKVLGLVAKRFFHDVNNNYHDINNIIFTNFTNWPLERLKKIKNPKIKCDS